MMTTQAQFGSRSPIETDWWVFLAQPTVDEPKEALATVTTKTEEDDALDLAAAATGYPRELLRVQAFGIGESSQNWKS